MCKMLLDGFYVGAGSGVPESEATHFKALRPDQVVIGVPASQSAAGSGQISNENLQAAFNELDAAYPGIRGIMTWSINWDSSQNGNSFAKTNGAFLQAKRAGEQPQTQAPTTKAPETTTKAPETTTKAPETTKNSSEQIVTNSGVEINGFQISYTVEGMRTVYTVANKIDGKDVVERGLVYGLGSYVNDSQLYVGSNSAYVLSYKATDAGKLTQKFSQTIDNGSAYAMTMKFSKKSNTEFTTNWIIRAYAKLSDGSIVYSDASHYTIYNIASKLYDGCKMNNLTGHNYLFENILTKVQPSYAEVDFDWGGGIVK